MKTSNKNISLSSAIEEILGSMKVKNNKAKTETVKETSSEDDMKHGPDAIKRIAIMVFEVEAQEGVRFTPKAIMQFAVFMIRSITYGGTSQAQTFSDDLNEIIEAPGDEYGKLFGAFNVFTEECAKQRQENDWSDDEFRELSVPEVELLAFFYGLASFLNDDQRISIIAHLADFVETLEKDLFVHPERLVQAFGKDNVVPRLLLARRMFVACCFAFNINEETSRAICIAVRPRNDLSVFDED